MVLILSHCSSPSAALPHLWRQIKNKNVLLKCHCKLERADEEMQWEDRQTTPDDINAVSHKSARTSRGGLTSAFFQVSYYALGKETEVAEVKKKLG